jgi:hypothetical protein
MRPASSRLKKSLRGGRVGEREELAETEGPEHRVDERPRNVVELARRSRPIAHHHEPGLSRGGVEIRERVGRRGQQHLVPNGEELSLDPQVGRRARVEASLGLSVQRRVDREGGDGAIFRSCVPTVSSSLR